jgi:hypothetical protein
MAKKHTGKWGRRQPKTVVRLPDLEPCDGAVVSPLAAFGREAVQDRRFRLFKIGKGQDSFGCSLLSSCFRHRTTASLTVAGLDALLRCHLDGPLIACPPFWCTMVL